MVTQTEISGVADRSLIKIQFCARDDKRVVYRGIGVHVRVAKLDLIDSRRSVVVVVRIRELSTYSFRKNKELRVSVRLRGAVGSWRGILPVPCTHWKASSTRFVPEDH